MEPDWITWALDGALLTVCIVLAGVVGRALVSIFWS
jgi:hypothetical protein